ncbi:hypothetical protein DYB35_009037, partial [Aphanomyces astaci]
MGTHYSTGFADGELTTVTQEIKHPNGIDVRIIILDRNITTIQPVVRVCLVSFGRTASAALFPRRVTDTMLGVGGEKGEDSCGGDLGGPLTIEINGVVRLVGVASWGGECGLLDKPG